MKKILFLVVVMALYASLEGNVQSFLRRPTVKATTAMALGVGAAIVEDKLMPVDVFEQIVWAVYRAMVLKTITEVMSEREPQMGSLSNAFCWGLYGKKSVTNLHSNKIFAGMNGAMALYHAKNMMFPARVSAHSVVIPSVATVVRPKSN